VDFRCKFFHLSSVLTRFPGSFGPTRPKQLERPIVGENVQVGPCLGRAFHLANPLSLQISWVASNSDPLRTSGAFQADCRVHKLI
jgi:hypothetical protein